MAVFGSIMNLYTSFATVDQEKIKLVYTLHGTRRHALFKVVLPSSVPSVISNMKVNIGLCLVGVVIGEFLAARNGLGYLIIYSSQVCGDRDGGENISETFLKSETGAIKPSDSLEAINLSEGI